MKEEGGCKRSRVNWIDNATSVHPGVEGGGCCIALFSKSLVFRGGVNDLSVGLEMHSLK